MWAPCDCCEWQAPKGGRASAHRMQGTWIGPRDGYFVIGACCAEVSARARFERRPANTLCISRTVRNGGYRGPDPTGRAPLRRVLRLSPPIRNGACDALPPGSTGTIPALPGRSSIGTPLVHDEMTEPAVAPIAALTPRRTGWFPGLFNCRTAAVNSGRAGGGRRGFDGARTLCEPSSIDEPRVRGHFVEGQHPVQRGGCVLASALKTRIRCFVVMALGLSGCRSAPRSVDVVGFP